MAPGPILRPRIEPGRAHWPFRPSPLIAQMSQPAVKIESWSLYESEFRRSVSVDRLRRYRQRSDKGQWLPGIARYLYNVEIARAVLPALHAAEVCLRNHLFDSVQHAYPHLISSTRDPNGNGPLGCWLDDAANHLQPDEIKKVLDAKVAYGYEQRKKPVADRRPMKSGHLVASLHFGFWTKLMDGTYANWRYAQNDLWGSQALMDRAFPYMPQPVSARRGIAHDRFTEIKELRNRAFHHERIMTVVNLPRYDRVLTAIHWINPTWATMLEQSDRPKVDALLLSGPAATRTDLDAMLAAWYPTSVAVALPIIP